MGRRENYENINNSTFGISLPAFPIGKERPVPDSCANPDAPTFRTNLKIKSQPSKTSIIEIYVSVYLGCGFPLMSMNDFRSGSHQLTNRRFEVFTDL